MDRQTVRRTAGAEPGLEGLVRSAARSVPQLPLQPSRPQRGQDPDRLKARLRRLRLFPARLFRLQDGAAVRLLELLARGRRQSAEVLSMVRRRTSRSDAPAATARSGWRSGECRAAAARGAAEDPRHLQPLGAAAGGYAGGADGEACAAQA